VKLVRRAALVHDAGMVGVPCFLFEGNAKWSQADSERYRLHTYYTERILSWSEALRPIGRVAAAHHERMDGRGYHHGLTASQLSMPARVVAAASVYAEAAGRSNDDPERALASLDTAGHLDPDCVSALKGCVTGAATERTSRRSYPGGLTEREVDVLRLVASGLNLKQAAQNLIISEHTARHHLESVYSKAGVSSRAGVTLFAVENGLVD
jgi:HD-GYP domain-containing protein (c-di-GMP phosphodiesterase class II)